MISAMYVWYVWYGGVTRWRCQTNIQKKVETTAVTSNTLVNHQMLWKRAEYPRAIVKVTDAQPQVFWSKHTIIRVKLWARARVAATSPRDTTGNLTSYLRVEESSRCNFSNFSRSRGKREQPRGRLFSSPGGWTISSDNMFVGLSCLLLCLLSVGVVATPKF